MNKKKRGPKQAWCEHRWDDERESVAAVPYPVSLFFTHTHYTRPLYTPQTSTTGANIRFLVDMVSDGMIATRISFGPTKVEPKFLYHTYTCDSGLNINCTNSHARPISCFHSNILTLHSRLLSATKVVAPDLKSASSSRPR